MDTYTQINPNAPRSEFVQKVVDLLSSHRQIVIDAVAEVQGADQRLYVQVVGVNGFPVFTVNPTGAYQLPFEHTYTNKGMKKMGLAILDGESESLNAVLFADELAERKGNKHDLCVGYDPAAIERVRQIAAEAYPQKSEMMWR